MGATNYRYYTIMSGLRGCYIPDVCYTTRVSTRRELKEVIAEEAKNQSCDGAFVGLASHHVAWAAAHAWGGQDAILPYGVKGGSKPYCIEVRRATRRDWIEEQKLRECA